MGRPREVAIPRLLHVGAGCLHDVGRLLEDHSFDLTRVLVGSGRGPSGGFARIVVRDLRARGAEVIHQEGLDGRLEQAARAAATVIEEGITTAVAVGGGRVIDVLKMAAARTGIEFVSVPTTISNDGISSPIASLVARDGTRATHAARMPCGVVVDPAAIATAPERTVRAGAADLVSNLTACMDWRLAERGGHERCDAYSAMIAEAAARPVMDLADVGSPASHEVLANGLLLSGLAMAAAGTSRPCSGAEHLVSHALDALLGPRAALHGEQVALGCLVSAAAHGTPLLGELRLLFRRLGLPLAPEDLGISRALVAEAVAGAPAVRPDRWTIFSSHDRGPEAVAALLETAFPVAPRRTGRGVGDPAPAPAGAQAGRSRRMRASTRSVA